MATAIDSCRVIVDTVPRSGAWNMAVDEALLDSAVSQGLCTLRWYRWAEPTLSLGYFQEAGRPSPSPELQGLPVVRRLSGGGAVVHDQELTYSCALPAGHVYAVQPRALYTTIHERIVAVLARWGVAARLRGTAIADRQAEFLCFGRGDDFDVVIGDHKVLGSAQRRRKGAVLQHGSLVLRRSPWAPRFPGIWDLVPQVVEPADFAWVLADQVARLLSHEPTYGTLRASELATAQLLALRRYDQITQLDSPESCGVPVTVE